MDVYWFLIIMLFFHWVADFVAQPLSTSTVKYNNIVALVGHCFLYMVIMFFGFTSTLLFFGIGDVLTPELSVIIPTLLFGSHFIVDFITSKINHSLYVQKRFYGFMTSIGFDQFIHLSVIVYIVSLVF